MNKKLIGVLLALSLPLTAIAVPPQPEDFGAHRIERMTDELGLNADQAAKVAAIFNDQKAKLKAVHEETRIRLQGILTPEQMTKLDELHQQGRHRPPGDGIDNGNAAP